jgi:DNA-directed RNA polymerase beta' subunit
VLTCQLIIEYDACLVGYYKEITRVLQSICKTCARVLLLPDEAAKLASRMRNPTFDRRQKGNIHKYVFNS